MSEWKDVDNQEISWDLDGIETWLAAQAGLEREGNRE
jgi:hypothetical protein